MKDPAPTQAFWQGLTSRPLRAAGADKSECVLSTGKVILIMFLYHTTTFPLCQAFFRLGKSRKRGKSGAKKPFFENFTPEKIGSFALQFFPVLQSKYDLRVFCFFKRRSRLFWLFFHPVFRPFFLLFQKVSVIYFKNRKFHLWKPSKRFLHFCAFCPNCERFFLHSKREKRGPLRDGARGRPHSVRTPSLPPLDRGLECPETGKFYLRKPLMISSSASFSLRPRVISLISCSPAIFPMAAS